MTTPQGTHERNNQKRREFKSSVKKAYPNLSNIDYNRLTGNSPHDVRLLGKIYGEPAGLVKEKLKKSESHNANEKLYGFDK